MDALSCALGERAGRPQDGSWPEKDILRLVRALLACVAQEGDALPADQAQVLLDIDVDGVRCVLAREPLDDKTRPQLSVALSPREQEITRMVAEGYPNKTIAAVLDISSWTVSTHLRRIFAKLGVRTRAAMVARVLEDGLMTQPGHEERRPSSVTAHDGDSWTSPSR